MRIRFDEQLARLNELLIEMGTLCGDAITYAVRALNENSEEMRKSTYETDDTIDNMEREIESLCLKLLLQQQPVARDLRVISAALKMISDMERIGDQARDIAEITEHISHDAIEKKGFCAEHIEIMAETTIVMVKESVGSFVKKDRALAGGVIDKDDIVDDMFDKVKGDLIDAAADDKTAGEFFVDILMIAKYLERIGDHAENIAEWVIFSMTGEHGMGRREE